MTGHSFSELSSVYSRIVEKPSPPVNIKTAVLIQSSHIIATSDSNILDGCKRWLNLARIIIDTISPEYDLNLLDLSEPRQKWNKSMERQ